ncbi:MAG: hypothetical protein WBD99_01870 [Thermodesulfobacteriota bacterium]
MTEDRTKLKSYSYLSKLYARTGASVLNPVRGLYRLGQELGFENEEIDDILNYISNEGLAIVYLNEEKVTITNKGIGAVEEAELNPGAPTKYFPAIKGVRRFGGSDESELPKQSYEARHDTKIRPIRFKELKKSTELIKGSMDKLHMTPELKSKLRAELITIDVQISQPKPDVDVIRECVRSIRSILENATESLLVRRLMSQLMNL